MSQEMDLAHPLSKAEFFEVFDFAWDNSITLGIVPSKVTDIEKCNIIPDHHLNLRSKCARQFELAYSAFASIK